MACITKRRNRWIIDFYDQHGKRRWITLPEGTTKTRAKLGHASPTITLNVYAHLMNPTNQEAACRLEKSVFEGSGSSKEKRVTV